MSAWNTGLYDNDVSPEVRDFYQSCLRNGQGSEEAERAVLSRFSEELEDEDDRIQVMLALADTEWRCGRLSDDVKHSALQILADGADADSWAEAGESYVRKRRSVLEKLRETLLSPQPKEKRLRKPHVFRCGWTIGDVYAYQLKSEMAEVSMLSGKWLIMQKVNEADNLKNGISPVVTLRLAEHIEKPVPELLQAPCIRVQRYLGYLWSYRLHLLLYTKKSISDFVFLGNTEPVLPADEHPHPNNNGYQKCIRKFLEETVIEGLQDFGCEPL